MQKIGHGGIVGNTIAGRCTYTDKRYYPISLIWCNREIAYFLREI